MPWPIRLVAADTPKKDVGDAWYIPASQIKTGADGRRYWYGHRLSRAFEARATRPPIAVVLPSKYGGTFFCVDSDATARDGGWQVSGDLPNLTISPSINMLGIYHGFVTNGVISDDVEGRRFEANG